MKKAHFQYVGYPRAGSTFLVRIFRQQAQLKDCTNSVVKEFYCTDLETYKNTYSEFDYSINMNPSTLLNRNLDYLHMTDPVTDKFFACIRNPYDAFSSLFALWNGNLQSTVVSSRFADCAENLIFFQSVISKPFKIFYFEDLVANEQLYIKNVCDFLEIETPVVNTATVLKHSSKEVYHNTSHCKDITVVNRPIMVRAPTDTIPTYLYSDQEIKYFNSKITELEQYLDCDFSHWKK
jgi:hypothetical protein